MLTTNRRHRPWPAGSRRTAPRAFRWRGLLAALWLVAPCLVTSSMADAQALPQDLRDLLAGLPADSLAVPLRRYEATHAQEPQAAEAAMLLGQLQYARGEYRRAAETFARAAARLDPERKPEARYWAGLSWLALGEPDQTRSALESVANGEGARRPGALLAMAQAWELAKRPDRAAETLAGLVAGDPGESGPAALERVAALAEQEGRTDQARRARERVLAAYPRSMEAATARLAVFSTTREGSAEAGPGAVAVVIGSFVDPGRARSLAAAARAAGFPGAQVVSHGEGLAAVHRVRIGVYARHAEARRAGEQASQALGVTYELTRDQ